MDLSEKTENTNRHPWELSRTDCLIKTLKQLKLHGRVLDVGCGDAYFDNMLLDIFPDITELYGVDTFLEEEKHSGKGHWIKNLCEIENKDFDFILLMDVIEHTPDDDAFLKSLMPYLSKNSDSLIFITVPAFQWLFSNHDVTLKHYRRYDYKMLSEVVMRNGLTINKWHYFYACLVPARLLTLKSTKAAGNWQRGEHDPITAFIRAVLNLDFEFCKLLSKIGIHIGGLSLFMTAKR